MNMENCGAVIKGNNCVNSKTNNRNIVSLFQFHRHRCVWIDAISSRLYVSICMFYFYIGDPNQIKSQRKNAFAFQCTMNNEKPLVVCVVTLSMNYAVVTTQSSHRCVHSDSWVIRLDLWFLLNKNFGIHTFSDGYYA